MIKPVLYRSLIGRITVGDEFPVPYLERRILPECHSERHVQDDILGKLRKELHRFLFKSGRNFFVFYKLKIPLTAW